MIISIACLISSCDVNQQGELLDFSGNRSTPSQEEIEQARNAVLNASDGKGLDIFDGGLLFDGKTIRVEKSESGIVEATLQIENLLYGEFSSPTITIHTPKQELGGISFNIGDYYRVFTVNIDGKYRTFKSMGTIPIDKQIVQ